MDYEKKYKDILARLEEAKNVNDVCDERYCCVINDIIPELNESEDERIRKRLIDFFEDWRENRSHCWGIAVSKILTWLEKQGEQETNKWKEGNIIRHGGILALVIKGRRVIKSNGEIFTVQYPDEWVKAAPNEIEHFLNEFEKQGKQIPANSAKTCKDEQKPATIDIDKMVDDYANNKERGNEEFGKPVKCMVRAYRQGLNDAIEKVMLKPAWSEEDEEHYNACLNYFEEIKPDSVYYKDYLWFKSLKERIKQ